MDGERQLGDEDEREERYCDDCDDVVDRSDMAEPLIFLDAQRVDAEDAVVDVDHGEVQPNAQCRQSQTC